MNKISIANQNNILVITNNLSSQEEVNLREQEMISKGMLEGILPVVVFKQKKTNCLRCTVAGKISLAQYFRGIVNKKAFLDIILRIIKAIKGCEKNRMNIRNLGLDTSYIFIDPRNNELSFIYWPIVNPQNIVNIFEFFQGMVFKAVFNRYEDTSYVSEYIKFFKNNEPFSFYSFERLITQLSGANPEMPESNVTIGPTGRMESTKATGSTTGGLSSNAVYNPLTANTSSTRQESYSSRTPEDRPIKKKSETQTFTETTVLGEEDEEMEGTTVLGEDELDAVVIPYLIREKTGEKINVDKPVFRIGKERQYSDYCVADNNAVSRKHADIIIKGGRYFIYDNNSKNKSFVEERAIPAQEEVEIFSGTKLRLANEKFTFYI